MNETEKNDETLLLIRRPIDRTPEQDMEVMPKNFALAMAYVPFQMWSDDLFEIEKALSVGTLFPELDKPFLAGREMRR